MQLSVLSGSTHLAPHHGIMNTKLRAHLPLLIPTDPAPVLVVAGQNITWTEGKMFLFDDTYEHEVSFALSNQPSLKCFISLYISSEINLWYKSELTGQVIHESDAQRIVLLIDLHHPELSEERRRLWQKRFQVTRRSVSGPTYVINLEDEVTQGEGGKDEL